jgi:large subunit ribosomal protein L18
MVNEVDKSRARAKRHARVRARVSGTRGRPRLCVFRSERHIYVQAIDDEAGATIASASTLELRKEGAPTSNVAAAGRVGALIAERLRQKGCEAAVFDRGGYLYHGRVMAIAKAAREAGLKF